MRDGTRAADRDRQMIYRRSSKHSRGSLGFLVLEEEKTKRRISGFDSGGSVKLKDDNGNTWNGTAESGPDNIVYYRLTDSDGRRLTGLASQFVIVFHDDGGNTWRGFVE